MTKSKLHIGTKLILALAMTLGDYNKYQGWTIPEDQNPSDEGFLVEYQDGGKANHPAHKGYISWSPKVVFDNSYNLYETFADRLQVEQSELREKLDKLASFIGSPTYINLPNADRELLNRQSGHMLDYLGILEHRISLL